MKLEKQILGIASAAALMAGMTGIGFGMTRPAQAGMTAGTNSSQQRLSITTANQVPTSITKVGEYGENIYDAAQANNWTQATTNLTSLQQAAKQLDNEPRIGENPNEDQLDGVIAALDKSVPAKDRLATMRTANQVTLLAANLSAPFNPQVPVPVVKLDYYGRQLQVGAVANNMNQLQETAKGISQTWNAIRPTIESHGGSAQAQKFNSLVAQVEAAKSSTQYSSLATPFLNQVDNLEKVFTH